MGRLAEQLNAPAIFKVAGHEIKAVKLSLSQIYDGTQRGYRTLDPSLVGTALQDAVEEAINTGKYPKASMEELVWEAVKDVNDGIDREDVRAMMVMDYVEEAIDIAIYAIGTGEASEKSAEGNSDSPEE